MADPRQKQAPVEYVYTLLATYGPATAYAYIQQAGDKEQFPESLVRLVQLQVRATNQHRRPHRSR